MSFRLIDGNDLEKMAEKFADLLVTEGDPFDEDVVVTTDNAVRRWLAVKVAAKKGFFPSVEWMRPGDFIYKYLFNPCLGRPQGFDVSGFEPGVTAWSIYKALGEVRDERVDNYVAKNSLRRWQLATRLAALFDEYMTYRRGCLAEWEKGNTLGLGPDESWQAEVWRKISAGREDTFSALCGRFLVSGSKPPQTRKRFFYFGVSLLPKVHLMAAMKLAEVADVWFFMTNPCREYWGDAATRREATRQELEDGIAWDGNQLLGELGQSGRSFFNDIYDLDANLTPVENCFAQIPENSLLGKVRSDIQNCAPVSVDGRRVEADGSLLVHACRSPLREVEVLKDRLFLAFKEIDGLKPGDVRVYVTDMEAYAPFIKAVFGDGKIPCRISAKSLSAEYPEFSAFSRILDLLPGRFRASEVADIISSRPVMERFALEATDANKITELITCAHAAWGRDAAHKDSAGGAKAYRHSWDFAIDRLVLGVAASDFTADSEVAVGCSDDRRRCVPEAMAEGAAHLVGVLSKAMELLCVAAADAKADRIAVEWYVFLKRLRDAFIPAAGSDGATELDRVLSSLVELVGEAGMADEPIPFAVVRSWFSANAKKQTASANSMSGFVTFSTFPSSGLALPARVVGMLGMNDGAFPPRDDKAGYDLLLERPEPGDPSNRRRGRYAFLQALMSAGDRLVVTYSAHSQKDGAETPPSIVVRELLDSLGGYFEKPSYGNERWRCLVVDHPLHPFGRRYFEAGSDPRLVTFDTAQERIAAEIKAKDGLPHVNDVSDWIVTPAGVESANGGGEKDDVLDVDAIAAVLKDPMKYFIENVVGAASKPMEEKSPADDEPVEFENTLDEYLFHQELTESVLGAGAGANADVAVRLAALHRIFLARHDAGGVPSSIRWNDLKPVYEKVFAAVPCGNLPENARIVAHMSKGLNGKGVVAALTSHLARLAANPESVTWAVSRPKNEKDNSISLKFTPPADASFAKAALEGLGQMLGGIRHSPIAFDAKVFWDAAKSSLLKGRRPNAAEYEKRWATAAESTDERSSLPELAKRILGESATDPKEFVGISEMLADIFLACYSKEDQKK